MNSIVAISKSLLDGNILTIKTAFTDYGVSNLPREIGRSIERKFNVHISKVQATGKSRYGTVCIWYEYRLNKTIPENKIGIEKMRLYISENSNNGKDFVTAKKEAIKKSLDNTGIIKSNSTPVYVEQRLF